MKRKAKILLVVFVLGGSLYSSIQIGFLVDGGMAGEMSQESEKNITNVPSGQAAGVTEVTPQPVNFETIPSENVIPTTPEPAEKQKKKSVQVSKKPESKKKSLIITPSPSNSPSSKKILKEKKLGKKQDTARKGTQKKGVRAIPGQTEITDGYSAGEISQIRSMIWKTMQEHCSHSIKKSTDLKNAAILRACRKGSSAMQILTEYGGKAWKQKRWKEVCGEAWVEQGKDSSETAKELIQQMAFGTNNYATKAGIGFFVEEDGKMIHIRAILILTD